MNFLSRIDWCNKSTSSFFYGLLVHGWLGVNINAKKKKKVEKRHPTTPIYYTTHAHNTYIHM